MGVKNLKRYFKGYEIEIVGEYYSKINKSYCPNPFADNNFIVSIDFTNFFWSIILIKTIQDKILQPDVIIDTFFLNGIVHKVFYIALKITKESVKWTPNEKIHQIHFFRDGKRPPAKELEHSLRKHDPRIVDFIAKYQNYILKEMIERLFGYWGYESCHGRIFHNLEDENATEADVDLCFCSRSTIPLQDRKILSHSKDSDIIPVSLLSKQVSFIFLWPIQFSKTVLMVYPITNNMLVVQNKAPELFDPIKVLALISVLGTDYTPPTYYGHRFDVLLEVLKQHEFTVSDLLSFKNCFLLFLSMVELLCENNITRKSANVMPSWKAKSSKKEFNKLLVKSQTEFISEICENVYASIRSLYHVGVDYFNLLQYWQKASLQKHHKRYSTNLKPIILPRYFMIYVFNVLKKSVEKDILLGNYECNCVIFTSILCQELLKDHNFHKLNVYHFIAMLSSYHHCNLPLALVEEIYTKLTL